MKQGWSVHTEIPDQFSVKKGWSVRSETPGQFTLKQGGQFRVKWGGQLGVKYSPESGAASVDINNPDVFQVYQPVYDAKAIEVNSLIKFSLPDRDSPYAILGGDKEFCQELASACKLEVLQVSLNKTNAWWEKEIQL